MNPNDIVKFNFLDRKPQDGELYICDNKKEQLYYCVNPKRTEELGWPGDKIQTVMPSLMFNSLNVEQINKLSRHIFDHKIKDGARVYLNISFQ